MRRIESAADLDALDFLKGAGLVTVVAQDAVTGAVLMVAHADHDALARTLETGEMHYTSRTRGLWLKGATSGNTQRVVALHADCDGDAVLAQVQPRGPACHTNETTCFGELPAHELARLAGTIDDRASGVASGQSYTRRLLDDRNLRLKKIGEEASELAVACADGNRARAVEECADLVYHALVALHAAGGRWDEVAAALSARRGAP